MKTCHIFGLALGVFALAVHQGLAEEYSLDNASNTSTIRPEKELTPEEQAFANQAQAHIAKTIEDNIVRLLADASARGDRRPRQDDEDDTDAITPNPNVLPQVAQILGAIFTGSLNISRVVDRTFGLVPNIVRNQVGGIVKLINGESAANETKSAETGTTAAPTTSTPAELKQTTSGSIVVEGKSPEQSTTEKVVETTVASTASGKYRIRNRTRGPTSSTKTPLEDDELIDKVADDIASSVEETKSIEDDNSEVVRDQNQNSGILASLFKNVMQRIDFNSTEIAGAVPKIFKGTQQAFKVLENLGILDVNDVLDELDLPNLEEEEDDD